MTSSNTHTPFASAAARQSTRPATRAEIKLAIDMMQPEELVQLYDDIALRVNELRRSGAKKPTQ